MARIIGEVRPRYVLVENSPMLVSRGLDVVLADLATLGFDVRWGVVGAHHVGAPHKRDRVWILADSGCLRRGGWTESSKEEWAKVADCCEIIPDAEEQEWYVRRERIGAAIGGQGISGGDIIIRGAGHEGGGDVEPGMG